jgi:rubrerythrin
MLLSAESVRRGGGELSERDLSLLEAIRIAKEAELKAATFYGDAVAKTSNPMGQRLFRQLAEFESHHFERLATLEESLGNGGDFIVYEGRDLALPAPGDLPGAKEASKMSVMDIISVAIELEREAEKCYTALASQTTHSAGHDMFVRLAAEERNHYRVLGNAYWNLNDLGEWVQPRVLKSP